jgi:hypothetical protein
MTGRFAVCVQVSNSSKRQIDCREIANMPLQNVGATRENGALFSLMKCRQR